MLDRPDSLERSWKMKHALTLFVAVAALSTTASVQSPSKTGLLLLAHGGAAEWNERVNELAKTVDQAQPVEVAFGMASRASIQRAIDKLTARGMTEIVAVPLFVSSHSSVITATEYLLKVRKDAPPELKVFAKMDHASHDAAAAAGDHAKPADPTSPVTTALPIRMTAAFNRHPIIGEIVVDRARSISTNPPGEAVILVAHGPVPEDDNRRWLEDMAVLAEQVRAATPFAAVDYMTVRDDAGPALREAATKELRSKVEQHKAAGRLVLIVPHLMSFGGIEQGIRKRLEGLDYIMTSQALMPDDRIAQWVLTIAR